MHRITSCEHCGCKVVLVNNREIYGKAYGKWPMVYKCTNCDSYVGTHPNTDIPLGNLATKDMREARKDSKEIFLCLYKSGMVTRSKAYELLSKKLGLDMTNCHFGMFDVEMCKRAKVASREIFLDLIRR